MFRSQTVVKQTNPRQAEERLAPKVRDMLVTDLRAEFYNLIKSQRVLVLVHFDLDGICASKILQVLFRTDHILYTVVPVQTCTQLLEAFQQHAEQVVLLVNCGGCVDLVEALQPPDDLVFFVADNHRPLHVCNIYSASQVRVLTQLGEEDEEVPAFEDVFRPDESEEENSSDDDGGGGGSDDEEGGRGKRRRFDEDVLEKRRQRRLWEQQRHKLLFDYTQFSFFGRSTALLMFELAWKLSKDSNDLLWLAIIGETEMVLHERSEPGKHLLTSASLQTHVSRLNPKPAEDAPRPPSDSLRITFEKDLTLALYRHWSLVESMRHSPHLATALRLWTLKGEKRLHELLAEMGLPLAQCRQLYCGMDVELRNGLQKMLEGKTDKYGLKNLFFMTFSATLGFRARMCASDYVHAAVSLLERPDSDESPTTCFLDAADALDLTKPEVLGRGIELRKQQLEAIYRQVQTFLDMNQVICAGPFLYATVVQGTPDARFFAAPHSLNLLATFTLRAHVSTSRSRKSRNLPLILTTPDVKYPEPDHCLVCGIPPVSEETHKNLLGKAFEQAAEKTNAKADLDYFDTNVVRLSVEDRSKFFDALISLLS
ncbi:cell division control protein 45 homolog isoform X2 [Scylla paramamosain]|uniref:cell division control protein 45 homolog isoform X2 n=1 Tax=Scylla paramamosain TaxID=85552 RepID=UPI003082A3E9